jgi:TolB-like protein
MPNKISQFWSKLKRRMVVRVITVFAIAAFVIVALIILNIIPGNNRINKKEIYEKSIVVLPFISDSPDKENEYFNNGIMESILGNLANIKDLRVISRTSAAHYRDNPKPISEIAEELNVRFVLEGSVRKVGSDFRLQIQLIDALNDKLTWACGYDGRGEELFALQGEIAQHVAEVIDTVIIPKE